MEKGNTKEFLDFKNCKARDIYPVYWNEFYKRLDEYKGEVIFNSARSKGNNDWVRLINTGIGGVFFSAVAPVSKGKIDADFYDRK